MVNNGLRLLCAALLWASAPASAQELLVVDWNPKVVTVNDHGFPKTKTFAPGTNGDWTQPIDYYNGTLHHRLEVRSAPTAKTMNFQCCFHQNGSVLEECGPQTSYFTIPVSGPPVVLTWKVKVSALKQISDIPIDWSLPRSVLFTVIRKGPRQYVSDLKQLNDGLAWAGEDPDEWYPMEIRFTTVVVAAGSTFSGWDAYIDPVVLPPAADAGAPKPDIGPPQPDSRAPGVDASPPLEDGAVPPLVDSRSRVEPDAGQPDRGVATAADAGAISGGAWDASVPNAVLPAPAEHSLAGGCTVAGGLLPGAGGALLLLLFAALRWRCKGTVRTFGTFRG